MDERDAETFEKDRLRAGVARLSKALEGTKADRDLLQAEHRWQSDELATLQREHDGSLDALARVGQHVLGLPEDTRERLEHDGAPAELATKLLRRFEALEEGEQQSAQFYLAVWVAGWGLAVAVHSEWFRSPVSSTGDWIVVVVASWVVSGMAVALLYYGVQGLRRWIEGRRR